MVLGPQELYKAMGFPSGAVIETDSKDWKPLQLRRVDPKNIDVAMLTQYVEAFVEKGIKNDAD